MANQDWWINSAYYQDQIKNEKSYRDLIKQGLSERECLEYMELIKGDEEQPVKTAKIKFSTKHYTILIERKV
jgi:5-methylcytosine-specific restriction endonuclease McrBC GTP-binding regulatory subunit McrB